MRAPGWGWAGCCDLGNDMREAGGGQDAAEAPPADKENEDTPQEGGKKKAKGEVRAALTCVLCVCVCRGACRPHLRAVCVCVRKGVLARGCASHVRARWLAPACIGEGERAVLKWMARATALMCACGGGLAPPPHSADEAVGRYPGHV